MRALTLALLLAATPAHAHDWYPLDCCSGMDCAPVDHVETVQTATYASVLGDTRPASVMWVTTRHGTASVPPNMQRRNSEDNRMHACIRGGKVICVFFPPGT